MNRTSASDTGNPVQAAPHWLLWIVGSVAVAVGGVALLLWGIMGPTYILDLIAAYCG
jgi:hypothetical protein